jgi:hypothetical protein
MASAGLGRLTPDMRIKSTVTKRVLMNDDPNCANVKLSSCRLRPSQSAYIDGPRRGG